MTNPMTENPEPPTLTMIDVLANWLERQTENDMAHFERPGGERVEVGYSEDGDLCAWPIGADETTPALATFDDDFDDCAEWLLAPAEAEHARAERIAALVEPCCGHRDCGVPDGPESWRSVWRCPACLRRKQTVAILRAVQKLSEPPNGRVLMWWEFKELADRIERGDHA